MNSLPNYPVNANDKDKFSKFPTKHHDKNPKYTFDDKQKKNWLLIVLSY